MIIAYLCGVKMQSSVQLLAKVLRDVFNRNYSRAKGGENEPAGNIIDMSYEDEGKIINIDGRLTFVHGHWTDGPYSAIFRITNLPSELTSGTGLVDFVIYIMPTERNPKIDESQIKINTIYKFKGPQINDFLIEFPKVFVEAWNKQK